MEKNEGMVDRVLRIFVGLVLLAVGVLTPYWWLIIVAIIPLVTGAIGICPLYKIFGIKTCTKNESCGR